MRPPGHAAQTGLAHDGFLATRTFGALDGLRALSVIAVIWQHTSGMPGPYFFSKGYLGVDLFFAISGFLITTLLLRERRRTGRISLRGFYIRRFFRIVPLYYAVLAVYVALVLTTRLGTSEGDGFLANLPAFLTYTSNWFVDRADGQSVTFYFAWSLATEEQFYLLWPPLLVGLLLLRRGRTTAVLTAVAALITVSQAAIASGGSSFAVTILSSLSLPILLGAAVAVVLDDARGFRLLSPALRPRWAAPTWFALMLASVVVPTPEQLTQVLMVATVAALCVREDTVLHPALAFRPLAHIGKVSYGVYLMHMLCANVVRLVLPDDYGIPLFALTAVAAIAAASVSHRFAEQPVIAYGRRLSSRASRGERRRTRPRAATTSTAAIESS